MKKNTVLLSVILAISLIGLVTFVIAQNNLVCTQEAKLCSDGSYVSRNSNNGCQFDACPGENDENIVGASCGTVTPGYQNECCVNKGYSGWDAEEFKCIGEDEEEETENHILGTVLGGSCGTVTPGYQNECCINKGYSGWDQEEFKCVNETEEEDDERDELVGTSCGTVTPGTENECCKRKGYFAWDAKEFECINKNEENEEECEEWNCTKWSECINGTRTRECVKSELNCTEDNEHEDNEEENETEVEEQPKLTKHCYEEKELRPHERTSIDCPDRKSVV
jgi:hypothetical protein